MEYRPLLEDLRYKCDPIDQMTIFISPFVQLALKSQEAQALQEQRDQTAAHLQQYSAGYQTLASEREQLHHQYLQQAQLMDRLQHDESQGRTQLELSHQQLQHAQVRGRRPQTEPTLCGA